MSAVETLVERAQFSDSISESNLGYAAATELTALRDEIAEYRVAIGRLVGQWRHGLSPDSGVLFDETVRAFQDAAAIIETKRPTEANRK